MEKINEDGSVTRVSEPQNLPPIKVAMIIDNQVVDILRTDNRLAAILLSEPLLLDVTSSEVVVGDVYDPDTGTFGKPELAEPEA